MIYRNLGNTGLKVSVLSFGNFTQSTETQEENDKIIKICWDAGINFFDTAESYFAGNSEISLGNSIKSLGVPREDLVIATKLFIGKMAHTQNAENVQGTSRKHLFEGLNGSLKRMDLDYVDILSATVTTITPLLLKL